MARAAASWASQYLATCWPVWRARADGTHQAAFSLSRRESVRIIQKTSWRRSRPPAGSLYGCRRRPSKQLAQLRKRPGASVPLAAARPHPAGRRQPARAAGSGPVQSGHDWPARAACLRPRSAYVHLIVLLDGDERADCHGVLIARAVFARSAAVRLLGCA
jgi:hypothetical protein